MPNPLSLAWSAFRDLPVAVQSGGPVAVILFSALIAGSQGWWVFGSTYDAMVKDRNEYKAIAFNCAGVIVDRAQASAKINEAVSPETAKPGASPTPKLAKVTLPVVPLTSEEKTLQKPKDAQPETLQKSIDTSKSIFQKNDVGKAQAEPMKKP